MNNYPTDPKTRDTGGNPDSIAKSYVLNEASGLYEPQAEQYREKCCHGTTGEKSKTPLFVNVPRDWWSLVISAATTFLLAVTIRYSYLQWRASDNSAKAARDAAYAACVGSQIARAAFIESIAASKDAHDAAVAATYQTMVGTKSEAANIVPYYKGWNVVPGGNMSFVFGIRNEGKTAAKDVKTASRLVFVARSDDPEVTFPKGDVASTITPRLAAGEEPASLKGGVPVEVRDVNGTFKIATTEDSQDILAGKKDLLFFLRIAYIDSLQIHHWVHVCITAPAINAATLGDPVHERCISFNKEDNNNAVSRDPRNQAHNP